MSARNMAITWRSSSTAISRWSLTAVLPLIREDATSYRSAPPPNRQTGGSGQMQYRTYSISPERAIVMEERVIREADVHAPVLDRVAGVWADVCCEDRRPRPGNSE